MRADAIDAAHGGLLEQALAIGEGQDPLLREGDELQIDDIAHAVAHLDHRVERGERRIGGVDVAADMQDAVRNLPAEDLLDAPDDVIVAERRLAFRPALDALPQRAAARSSAARPR